MAITFPSNPSAGDIFTSNGRSWQWDGSVWTGYGVLPDPTVFAVDATTDTVTVTGNLNVSGTTTTINTTELNVQDNIVLLNSGVTGVPSLDAGIEVERGDEANAQLLWDESAGAWAIASDFTVDTDTLHVDSTNDRVGIGTATPGYPLDVVGDVNVSQSITSEGLTVQGSATVASDFTVDTSTLHVDSTNNRVGIGTTTPSQTLHVNSGAGNVPALFESTDSVSIIQIKDNATTTPPAVAAVGDELRLQTSGSSRVTVDSSGNVGIGTTVPSQALDVVGNIAVSGTVDGRDIASDGSKLDGIESGATADQTASEILTAIKTVDGSGSGLDADTVDGIDSSQFVRSDTSDTMNGTLTVTGGGVFVNAGGNIAMNRANATSSTTAGGLEFRIDGTTYASLHQPSAGYLSTSAYVGIGTTTPTGPLHIRSADPTIWLTDTNTNADSYVSANSSVGSLVLSADENNEIGSSQMAFKVDGSTKMGLQANGNLEMLGGTVKGNGAVVQMASNSSGASDLTSSANVHSLSFTPKYSTSTILVLMNYHAYKYNTTQGVNNFYQLYYGPGTNVIRQNNYLVYSSPEYMFQGLVHGTAPAGSTSTRTYWFYVTASGAADRIYFYWKTMTILEIAA